MDINVPCQGAFGFKGQEQERKEACVRGSEGQAREQETNTPLCSLLI